MGDHVAVVIIMGLVAAAQYWWREKQRIKRKEYYLNEYLKSEAWQRKRALVLKRDQHRCVYCGAPANQVHHKRYARQIGREPISWLVSICPSCHAKRHD